MPSLEVEIPGQGTESTFEELPKVPLLEPKTYYNPSELFSAFKSFFESTTRVPPAPQAAPQTPRAAQPGQQRKSTGIKKLYGLYSAQEDRFLTLEEFCTMWGEGHKKFNQDWIGNQIVEYLGVYTSHCKETGRNLTPLEFYNIWDAQYNEAPAGFVPPQETQQTPRTTPSRPQTAKKRESTEEARQYATKLYAWHSAVEDRFLSAKEFFKKWRECRQDFTEQWISGRRIEYLNLHRNQCNRAGRELTPLEFYRIWCGDPARFVPSQKTQQAPQARKRHATHQECQDAVDSYGEFCAKKNRFLSISEFFQTKYEGGFSLTWVTDRIMGYRKLHEFYCEREGCELSPSEFYRIWCDHYRDPAGFVPSQKTQQAPQAAPSMPKATKAKRKRKKTKQEVNPSRNVEQALQVVPKMPRILEPAPILLQLSQMIQNAPLPPMSIPPSLFFAKPRSVPLITLKRKRCATPDEKRAVAERYMVCKEKDPELSMAAFWRTVDKGAHSLGWVRKTLNPPTTKIKPKASEAKRKYPPATPEEKAAVVKQYSDCKAKDPALSIAAFWRTQYEGDRSLEWVRKILTHPVPASIDPLNEISESTRKKRCSAR